MTTSSEIKLAIEKFIEENKKYGTFEEFISKLSKLIKDEDLSFGTHSAKHIHSSSKADNVRFVAKADLPENLLGSQVISDEHFLDAFRGATYTTFSKFLIEELEVGENKIKIKDLLLDNDPVLKDIFPVEFLEIFQKSISGKKSNHKSDERNKQILWYCPEKNDYICLVPLYPVELAYNLDEKIKLRYSDEVKEARELKNKNKAYLEGFVYPETLNLAFTKIGGSGYINQNNVSHINPQKRGIYNLIPSIPPNFKNSGIHFSKRAKSFFCNELIDREIRQLFVEVVESEKNNLEVRNKRQEALDLLCAKSLTFAQRYREQKANWTDEYSLSNTAEIYWLDPNNSKFSEKSNIPLDWQEIIAEKFASWLMSWFKNNKTFASQKDFFSDAEYMEFLKTFKRAISLGD